MPKHFPKLNALRAFEAAARHLSFTRAAQELNLTQTAISHQIRELEMLLATRLFERSSNKVALTERGLFFLRQVRPALVMIGTAADEVSDNRRTRLHIACISTFSMKCLIPALPGFRKRYPDIGIRVTPFIGVDRLAEQDFDIGIGYGVNTLPNVALYRCLPDDIFPVCSPSILARAPLREPQDLMKHTILRSVSPMVEDDWSVWLAHVCDKPMSFQDEISFNGLFLTVEAALSGLGICMGRSWLIRKELASGALVAPFEQKVRLDASYFLVHRKDHAEVHKIRVFREWMLEMFSRRKQLAAR